MTSENNKKWSSTLVATMGFLGGIIAISGIVGYNAIDYSATPSISFVTQQFLGTRPFASNTNNAHSGNTNTGTNQVHIQTTAVAPNPVSPALFGRWNYLFQMIMANPNPPVSPVCKVKGVVTVAAQPGSIHYEVQADPMDAKVRCGLIDLSTNLLMDLAPVDAVSFDFINLPEGKYDVACLVRNPGIVNIVSSLSYCKDGEFLIDAASGSNSSGNIANSTGIIDLELYGGASAPAASGTIILLTGSINPVQQTQLMYQFKVHNSSNSGSVIGSQLRIYPNNLMNIVISGAVQSGSAYLVDLGVILPGGSVGVAMEGATDPAGSGSAYLTAELCNYTNDVDSQPCNMVNFVPSQDDEIKL